MAEKIQLSKSDRQKSLVAFTIPSRFLELRTYAKLGLGLLINPSYQKNYTLKKKTKRLLLSVTLSSSTLTHT